MSKKDMPCSLCGRPMWRDARYTLPEGQATCIPCRRKRRAAEPTQRYEPELRPCQQCGQMFEANVPSKRYCSARCRDSRRGFASTPRVASATERGYGAEHRKARAEWKSIVDAQGGIDCCLCGGWIGADEKWHLDHTPERDGYRGAAHPHCNVRDGASRGARRSNQGRAYTKPCTTCGHEFTTPYPKQAYCSAECRPRRQTSKPKPRKVIRCMDCSVQIKQGKRCQDCRRQHTRDYMRNRYRAQVGIPLDAPKHDRSWRAA
jgi:hypothetical protein